MNRILIFCGGYRIGSGTYHPHTRTTVEETFGVGQSLYLMMSTLNEVDKCI